MEWYREMRTGPGPLVEDLADVDRNAEAVAVTGKTRNFDHLAGLKRLRVIRLREISQHQLDTIAGLDRLADVEVYGFTGHDASVIGTLPKLGVLSFSWAHKIETIAWIENLRRLEYLRIGDMKQVTDFSPIAQAGSLRFLSIHSGINGPMQRIRTIKSFTALRKLEDLGFGVVFEDGDLAPLTEMPWLEWLAIPNGFPLEVYAYLAVRMPKTSCDLFAPIYSWSLGDESHVTLTGRPARSFMAADPKAAPLIAKRSADFDRWVAHFETNPNAKPDGWGVNSRRRRDPAS